MPLRAQASAGRHIVDGDEISAEDAAETDDGLVMYTGDDTVVARQRAWLTNAGDLVRRRGTRTDAFPAQCIRHHHHHFILIRQHGP